MKHLTIFSWGYWGWGNSVERFLECTAAVESSRGFKPPVFVDARISRSVRAVGFNGKNFENTVGQDRYHWMRGLGNRAVIEKKDVMQIDNPAAAANLLDLAIKCDKERRRVLFFCSCEWPAGCHRAEVARLVHREAKSREIATEVIEWPGGEPITLSMEAAKTALTALSKGAKSFPLGINVDLGVIGSIPWGSTVTASSDDRTISFISGPACYRQSQWCLPVIDTFADPDAISQWIKKDVMNWRKENGYRSL